jgi:hypothetical protein
MVEIILTAIIDAVLPAPIADEEFTE